MNLTVYIRQHPDHHEEIEAAWSAGFNIVHSRCAVGPGDLVVPRYSLLPFPRELEADVTLMGARLLYPASAHALVSDIVHISATLGEMTPRTYVLWHGAPEQAYIVKGLTNSRKHQWNSLMFAPTLSDAHRIAGELLKDSLIGEQGVVLRQYVPLRTFAMGLNGLPITNEWRLFYYRGKFLCGGYYWSSHPECEWMHWGSQGPEGEAPVPPEARALGDQAAREVYASTQAVLFAVDVAERADGGWIVIEVNDGCQSGTSMISPMRFYRELEAAIRADPEFKD